MNLVRRVPLPPLPKRIADAIDPGATRDLIPRRIILGREGVPYSGEVREEQWGTIRGKLQPGTTSIVCGLRRAWRLIGFAITPGDAAGSGASQLVCRLQVLTAGLNAFTAQTFPVVNGGGAQAFIAIEAGCRCEVVVVNNTASPVVGIKAAIWGMNED